VAFGTRLPGPKTRPPELRKKDGKNRCARIAYYSSFADSNSTVVSRIYDVLSIAVAVVGTFAVFGSSFHAPDSIISNIRTRRLFVYSSRGLVRAVDMEKTRISATPFLSLRRR